MEAGSEQGASRFEQREIQRKRGGVRGGVKRGSGKRAGSIEVRAERDKEKEGRGAWRREAGRERAGHHFFTSMASPLLTRFYLDLFTKVK